MKIKRLLLACTLGSFCAWHIFAGPLGPGFTYQGRLEDGGTPANGTYDLIFDLYDAPTNGNPIGSFSIVSSVPVSNGLFTVELNTYGEFGTNAFNGQARWLELGVRTNTGGFGNNFTILSPRQTLDAAPQAAFALDAQTASLAIDLADGVVTSSKLAPGAVEWSSIAAVPAGFADGVDNDTTYAAGPGLTLGGPSNQFSVSFNGSGSADSAARSDHDHFGANWSGTSSGFGLTVLNNSTTGSGVYSRQGTGSGVAVPFSYRAAVWAESSQGDGVYGASGNAYGSGVYGYATHPTAFNYGVYGQSDSALGNGVFGIATSLAGTNCHGVVGQCYATNYGSGVLGRMGYAVTNLDKYAYLAGVVGESHEQIGVAGFSDLYDGVYGESINLAGVYGNSQDGTGVAGFSFDSVGVEATSIFGDPIDAYSMIGAFNFARVFRVSDIGDVYARGTFHPGGADFAEMLPAHSSLEPGDVVVIGQDGKLARSTRPYQENVAGVHATKPGLVGGAEEGADLAGKIPLAVVGVVPVKATTENGPIHPGDKLTTSSTPGHAMKAGQRAALGTIIGKALTGLEGKHGVIRMLVVLQ